MPVKINNGVQFTGPGNAITLDQLRAMKERYANNPGGSKKPITTYAHVQIRELMELIIDNKIAQINDPIASLIEKLDVAIRIYFAQHIDITDCPIPTAEGHDYVGRNTVILVCSVLENKVWNDRIENGDAITTSGFYGLDRTNLCPPQCNPNPPII